MSDEAAIRPEPTEEEAAAILAAVHIMRQARAVPSPRVAPARTGWQRAARREALRKEMRPEAGGWERAARGG